MYLHQNDPLAILSGFSTMTFDKVVGLIQLLIDDNILKNDIADSRYFNMVDLRIRAIGHYNVLNNQNKKDLLIYLWNQGYFS